MFSLSVLLLRASSLVSGVAVHTRKDAGIGCPSKRKLGSESLMRVTNTLLSSKMVRVSTALLCAVLVSVRGQTIIQPQMISDGTGDLEIRVPAGRNGETTRHLLSSWP
jgi:hypothetical protein